MVALLGGGVIYCITVEEGRGFDPLRCSFFVVVHII